MDLHHGVVEGLAQLAEFVAAVHLEADGHVAARDLLHHPAQLFQGGAGGDVEGAVQVDDGEEHQQQRAHQHDHLALLGGQALFQLAADVAQHAVFQAMGLRQQRAGFVEELLPGAVQRLGHDQAVLEQLEDVLQRLPAGGDIGGQRGVGRRAGGEYILQLDGVVAAQLFQVQLQLFELAARG
ncbi:hypothetical protein D3C76_648380 [compost metagenome]